MFSTISLFITPSLLNKKVIFENLSRNERNKQQDNYHLIDAMNRCNICNYDTIRRKKDGKIWGRITFISTYLFYIDLFIYKKKI